MPYTIRKIKQPKTKKVCYQVVNPVKGRVFSKCTTEKKAKKQVTLLRAIQYNPKFVPRGRVRGGGGNKTQKKRTTTKTTATKSRIYN